MEKQIKKQLEELISRYAYYAYTDQYSSSNYAEYKEDYRTMIAPLITLAKATGIDLEGINASYCDWTVKATDFKDYEELTRYW